MSIRNILATALVQVASVATLVASLGSASAMTLESPLAQSAVPVQVEKVWYCRWNCGGWRPGYGYRAGYGWTPGWHGPGWQGPGWGAVAAGAVIGTAVAAPLIYSGPCWQRFVGPYGGVHWRRVC